MLHIQPKTKEIRRFSASPTVELKNTPFELQMMAESEHVAASDYVAFASKLGADWFDVAPYTYTNKKNKEIKIWVLDNEPSHLLGVFQIHPLGHSFRGPACIAKYKHSKMVPLSESEMKKVEKSIIWCDRLAPCVAGDWSWEGAITGEGTFAISQSTDKLHRCVCGFAESSKKCGRCKVKRYCSKLCQSKDWTKHKQECRSATPSDW